MSLIARWPASGTLTPGFRIPSGSKACLTPRERSRYLAGHTRDEQRRAQPTVAVLAAECAAERGRERHDVIEQALDALAPIGPTNIDERIHVHVRVAGVSEDHAANVRGVERTHGRRARSRASARGGTAPSSMNCIDLSAGSRRVRIGLAAWRSAQSACSVGVVQRELHGRRAAIPRMLRRARARFAAAADVVSPSTSASSTASALRIVEAAAFRPAQRRRETCGRAARRRTRRHLARAVRRATASSSDENAAEETRRRAGYGCERELDSDEERERSLAADKQIDELAALGEIA